MFKKARVLVCTMVSILRNGKFYRLSCADMYFGDKCFDKINRINRINRIGFEIMLILLILSEEIQRMKGGVGRVGGILTVWNGHYFPNFCFSDIMHTFKVMEDFEK